MRDHRPTLSGHTIRWEITVLLYQGPQSGDRQLLCCIRTSKQVKDDLLCFIRAPNQVRDHWPTFSGHPLRWETTDLLSQGTQSGERSLPYFIRASNQVKEITLLHLLNEYCSALCIVLLCYTTYCFVLLEFIVLNVSMVGQSQEDSNINRDVYVPNNACQDWDKYEWIGKLMGACFRSKENLVSRSGMKFSLLFC